MKTIAISYSFYIMMAEKLQLVIIQNKKRKRKKKFVKMTNYELEIKIKHSLQGFL